MRSRNPRFPSRHALGCRVARSIGARDVIAELEKLFDQHGKPKVLRSDNGDEFIAESLGEWLAEQGVKTAFIVRAERVVLDEPVADHDAGLEQAVELRR